MAQGRSTKIISMIKWIRTSRLLTKNFLSDVSGLAFRVPGFAFNRVVRSGGAVPRRARI